MLEKLLELLLNAKSGAIAGVFLIGTTGALVTATVQNGVTTITVTTPSASPSASASASASPTASASASPTASATASPTASPSSSPSSSASANTCEQQARAMAAAVQEVDRAFSADHSALEKLRERARTDTLRTDLVKADNTLKQLRQSAVKAIHETFTCAKTGEQDSSDNDREDNDDSTASPTPTASASPTATATPTATPTPSPTPTATATATSTPLVTGNTPKAIADSAVAAMKVVFDTIVAEFGPAPSASAHPSSTFGHDRRGASGEHD